MPPPQGLARYGSAPSSFLAALADSVTRGDPAPPPPVSRFFSGESSGLTSCESSGRTADGAARPALQRAYGGSGEIRVPPPPPPQQQQQPVSAQMGQHGGGTEAPGVSTLFRHSSSPAGLLSRLMADHHGTSCPDRLSRPALLLRRVGR
ncbi:hypothetical protein EJB05_18076, partial [Eragrostis curvula]